jgi:hypothetical protein
VYCSFLLSKDVICRPARLTRLKTEPDAFLIQCEIINIHAGAENRPQFTFGFSALFVNPISSVSTGFFRFLSVLYEIRFILLQKPAKNASSASQKPNPHH